LKYGFVLAGILSALFFTTASFAQGSGGHGGYDGKAAASQPAAPDGKADGVSAGGQGGYDGKMQPSQTNAPKNTNDAAKAPESRSDSSKSSK